MDSSKKIKIGCGVALVLPVIGIIALYFMMECAMIYYSQDYKPEELVLKNDEIGLRNRFYYFYEDKCRLTVEWNTYDNKVIYKPPYKLFMVSSCKEIVEEVYVDSVKIISDKNKEYYFADTIRTPIYLYRSFRRDSLQSFQSEPGFDFNFSGGEKINMKFIYHIKSKNGNIETRKFDIKFIPITVKHYAPIV